MKSLTWRRLTPAEHALAVEMFGQGLKGARVRIFALPLWNRAFVAGPAWMFWPAATALSDFAAADAPITTQATFVHELTHIWQAQHGVDLLWAKLRAGDQAAAYAYDLSAAMDFSALNIEQQAMVVEHTFLASRGEPAPHNRAIYAQISQAWRA